MLKVCTLLECHTHFGQQGRRINTYLFLVFHVHDFKLLFKLCNLFSLRAFRLVS